MPNGKAQYVSYTPQALHDAFKAKIREGQIPLTIQEGIELAMLLVLAERGVVSSAQEAVTLGVSVKSAVAFGRIAAGEPW